MKDIAVFIVSAFFEIFGCFAFWSYIRMHKSPFWLIPGIISLILFAFMLTKVHSEFAGRAFAIYGGIYIVSALLWLFLVEKNIPDRWDMVGASLSISGAMIILFMPR